MTHIYFLKTHCLLHWDMVHIVLTTWEFVVRRCRYSNLSLDSQGTLKFWAVVLPLYNKVNFIYFAWLLWRWNEIRGRKSGGCRLLMRTVLGHGLLGLRSLFCRDYVIWAKSFCLNGSQNFRSFFSMSLEPEISIIILKQNLNIWNRLGAGPFEAVVGGDV